MWLKRKTWTELSTVIQIQPILVEESLRLGQKFLNEMRIAVLHYCTQSTAQKIYVFHSDIFIERAELLFKTQEYLRNELHSKAGKMFQQS